MKLDSMEERMAKKWKLLSHSDILRLLFSSISTDSTDKTLSDLLDTDKLVVCSYVLGKISAGKNVGLRSSQLRRLYEKLIEIKGFASTGKLSLSTESVLVDQLKLLKPLLAYAQSRDRTQWTPMFEVINPMIDRVRTKDDFERFFNFFQATLAYHKFCGGRD